VKDRFVKARESLIKVRAAFAMETDDAMSRRTLFAGGVGLALFLGLIAVTEELFPQTVKITFLSDGVMHHNHGHELTDIKTKVEVANQDSEQQHQLVVYRGDFADDSAHAIKSLRLLSSGETATATFSPDAGKVTLACALPGHREHGEIAVFEVPDSSD
jgi:hypothetical protein